MTSNNNKATAKKKPGTQITTTTMPKYQRYHQKGPYVQKNTIKHDNARRALSLSLSLTLSLHLLSFIMSVLDIYYASIGI